MLFKDERFGLFVHWGIYSVGGWHEQEQWRRGIEKEEYIKYMNLFDPAGYSPDRWLLQAKKAGMQYVVFTAKHHDGFCMWDTQFTDYNVMHTPYGKDVLAEVAESCKKHGLKLGLYYSVPDWHCPYSVNFGGDHQLARPNEGDTPDEDKYKTYIKKQMTELLSGKYGEICALFWDIPPYNKDDSVNEFVRKLMPGIFINDRGYSKGDYSTPEREVPKNKAFSGLTEACQSVGRESWGYRKNEDYLSHTFIEVAIDAVMCKGGNYLLNVGPDSRGNLPAQAEKTLKQVGSWFNRVSESYFGAELVDVGINPAINDVTLTKKVNFLYIHMPVPAESDGLALKPISVLPKNAVVLNNGAELTCELAYMPFYFFSGSDGGREEAYLHVMGIPVNDLAGEVIVLRLEFEDLEAALQNPTTEETNIIL